MHLAGTCVDTWSDSNIAQGDGACCSPIDDQLINAQCFAANWTCPSWCLLVDREPNLGIEATDVCARF